MSSLCRIWYLCRNLTTRPSTTETHDWGISLSKVISITPSPASLRTCCMSFSSGFPSLVLERIPPSFSESSVPKNLPPSCPQALCRIEKATVDPFDAMNRAQQDRIKRSNEANVHYTLLCSGEHEDGQRNPSDSRNRPQNFQRRQEGVLDHAGTGNPNPNRYSQNRAHAEAREYSNQARTDVTRGIGRLNELDEGSCDCDWPEERYQSLSAMEFGLAGKLPKANEDSERHSTMDKSKEAAGTTLSAVEPRVCLTGFIDRNRLERSSVVFADRCCYSLGLPPGIRLLKRGDLTGFREVDAHFPGAIQPIFQPSTFRGMRPVPRRYGHTKLCLRRASVHSPRHGT